MADIFDQIAPDAPQGNPPTPSKGLKFNDSSAAGAPRAPQQQQVSASTPSTGDIFDKIAPNEDVFDQLQPDDSHYRQLYQQQKSQGFGDIAKGAWQDVKSLGKMVTGVPAELGTAYGQIESSAEQNPLTFNESEPARQLRATLLEGVMGVGRNYLNEAVKNTPSMEDIASSYLNTGGNMPGTVVGAAFQHQINKPGGIIRNLLKKTGIINPTPEEEEAEYQAWKRQQQDKEELEKTPAAPAALQQIVSGGAQPLPQTTAAVSMAADPLNYLSLGAAPAAQALRKVEAGANVASAAERAAQMAGTAMKTGGSILEKTGELPETVAQKVAESALGPQASEAVNKFISGAKVASVPLAVVHGGTPEIVGAALEGAKRAGKALSGAGEVTTALAEADRNNPFGRLAALAKDPDAPEWMRYAASSPLVRAAAPAISAAKDTATGTAHGVVIGAAMGVGNADTPEELGGSIGQMAAIGGAGRALTLPMQNKARVMQKMAGSAAELYHKNVTAGTAPETMAKIADSTMMNAAAAHKMFGDVNIRFLDGENGQFADQATKSDASTTSAGFWSPTDRTIYLNADSGRGADTTLLHELMHPLFDSVVANRPELKAQIDSSLQRTGKTLDQAKQDYAQQVVGEHGFTNREDFDRAANLFIDNMDKNSQAIHNDPNHWIYSELMAEAGMKAMSGKNLVTDVIDPSLSARAVQGTKSLLEGLGVKFNEGQSGKTIFPNFEDAITSPELRKSTYSLLRSMKEYRPGIDEPEPQGVKITPETMGQHPGAPIHVLPNGEMGNDFMSQSASGKAVQRPKSDIRKIVRSRRAEVNAAYPIPQTEAPTTQDPKLQWRKTPSGLSERSGTTLGPDFNKLRTFNDDTKAKAKDLEDAISKGEARQGWYQQVGEGPDWRGSVSRDTGAVTAQHKQFLPINFHVDKQGNILVRNYSLGAFNDKAQVWAGRHGPLSLDLWDGNVGDFKKDVTTYLENHKNNLSGDTGIGEAKKNAINAFLVGKNVTWEKANPLRSGMRNADTQGVVRSYRLDRLETLAPHETEFAKPDYAKQVKNLSPEARATPDVKTGSPSNPEELLKFLESSSPEDFVKIVKEFKGQYGSGMTGLSFEVGSKVKTPEQAQALLDSATKSGEAMRVALKNKDLNSASNLATRSQAAREAYEAATDTGGSGDFIRSHYDPEYRGPLAAERAKEPVSMSPDEPKTFMVRHGSTEMNDSNPDKDLIRGHIDVPLDKQGRAEARKAGKEIAAQGGVDHIVTSDLSRAAQTARAIAAQNPKATIEIDPRLRPWNFGPTIEGKPTSEMLPKIKELTENPDTRPPGGETFNEFKNRFLEGYHDAQSSNADKNTAIVTHYRGTKLMDAWRAAGVDNDDIVKAVFEDYDKNKKPGNVQLLNKAGEAAKISQSPDLVHYSNEEGLKTLEPAKHGTGLLGAESIRKRDYPEIYQPRTYFGTKGYEKEPGLGEQKYKAFVKSKDLYDFEKDPKDLYPGSDELEKYGYAPMDKRAAVTLYEKKIKDAGYEGYVSPTERPFAEQKAFALPDRFSKQAGAKPSAGFELPENTLPKGEIRGPVQAALPEGTDKSRGRVRTVQESQHLDLDAIKAAPDTEKYRKKVVEQFRTQPGFRDIDPADTNKALDEIDKRVQNNLQFLYDRAKPEDRALWKQWYDFAHDMSHRWGKEYGIHGDVVSAINARLSPQMEWNNNVTLTRRALDTIKKDPKVTQADLEFLKEKITKEDTEENPQTQQSKNLMNRQLEALAGMKEGDKMSDLNELQAGMLMRSHNELYAARSPLHDHNLNPIPGGYLKWSKPFQDLADVVSIYRNPSFENVSELLGGNHKVRSFYNNHVAPESPLWTTIDTHATAAANLYPYGGSDKAVISNFGNPNHKNSGVNGVYPVYQDAYEKVAKANGILPRELQSIVWEQMRAELNPAAKRMVQDAQKKGVSPFEPIWAKAEKGEITREEAQKQIVAEFEKWNSKANHGVAAAKRAAEEAREASPITAEELERVRQEFERAKKRGNELLPERAPLPPKSYRRQRLPEQPF